MADDANPRVFLGANNPPPDAPDPFGAFEAHITDLMETATGFLDGAPIDSDALAERIAQLMDECRTAAKDADKARTAEKRPHDEAAKAVQAKWKPLLDRAERAVTVCKDALRPWLERIEAEKRAAAEAAQLEAECKAEEARAAVQAASAADLSAREAAEAKLREARAAEQAAKNAASERAQAHGGARATTLRTNYVVALADGVEAARWAWKVHRPECEAFFTALAQKRADAGLRTIPGFSVEEHRSVV